MKTEQEVSRALENYSDMVYRICFYHLKSRADTEDVFQNVFLKYLLYQGSFVHQEHERAWFARVTINACKDFLKSLFRRPTVPLETMIEEVGISQEQTEVLEAVLALPEKYRDTIYLHYYEGYTAAEIGQILQKNENTVYSLLHRGRGMLKKQLGGEPIV